MLTVHGDRPGRYCDGLSRRSFLRVGGASTGAFALPGLLRSRAEAKSPVGRTGKSVIMICLGGGPSHIDTYDMRPDAPAEYSGEFKPIHSVVPGLAMCELMPRQADVADRFAVVRSMQWSEPCHQYSEMCTGFPVKAVRPSFGAIVNRLHPGGAPRLPRFVDLAGDGDKVRAEEPGYAGTAYRAFRPTGPTIADFSLPKGVSLERLDDRKRLLGSFDLLRRDTDRSGELDAMDAFTQQAFDMVTGDSVRAAFDLGRESPKLLDRYGDKRSHFTYLGVKYAFDFESFVRARRLAEAGVLFVSLSVARWDHHCLVRSEGSLFDGYRTLLPLYDRAVAALVEDLHDRGLDRDVAVVVWGEFGRTPRVNKTGGRDHWPAAGSALIAGGGLRMGQYVGSTDARAERPKTRPYGPQNILATLYGVLGIDSGATIRDGSGRPMYLLDDRDKIAELL